jgi:hypothetical protein
VDRLTLAIPLEAIPRFLLADKMPEPRRGPLTRGRRSDTTVAFNEALATT